MQPEEIQKILFGDRNEKYGDKYIEHLLDQYKTYLASAEKISDRRQRTNEFFLGLNTGLVTLLGFIVSKSDKSELALILTFASIAGITVCYLWYRIVASYKGLNDGKFRIIHAIESRLPLTLYETEWEVLGKGKDKNVYWPFTHIELKVPIVFILIYILLLFSLVPWAKILFALKFSS